MPDPFDPYYKWLGIPPKDQPPNHYRLLAIELFETDPDVIDAAANRQMAYIQDFGSGPQVAHSQKLLNEISAARLCLLNAQRKAEYDLRLESDLQAKQKQKMVTRQVPVAKALAMPLPAPPPITVPLAESVAVTPLTQVTAPQALAPSFVSPRARKNRQSAWVTPAAIVASVLMLAAALAFFLRGEEEPTAAVKKQVDLTTSKSGIKQQQQPVVSLTPVVPEKTSPVNVTPPINMLPVEAKVVSSVPVPSRLHLPPGQDHVTLPANLGGGLLFADVSVNGHLVSNCILDTGVGYLALNLKTADELGLPEIGRVTLRASGESRDVSRRQVRSLEIAGATMEDLQVAAVDFTAWEQTLGVPIGGQLGSDLWAQLPFTIDYSQPSVTFHERATFAPSASAIENALAVVEGRPFVPGWIQVHERSGQWLLATGVPAGFTLAPGRDVELRERAAAISTLGIAGNVELHQAWLPVAGFFGSGASETWACVAATDDPIAGDPDKLGILGAARLRYYRLAFDYNAGRMWSEPVGIGMTTNGRDLLQLTPLMMAAQDGNLDILRQVLTAKPDLEAKDPQGQTALKMAADRGYANLVQTLLVAGANANAVNARGETPLMVAAQTGHLETAEVLLRAGAMPDARGLAGLTPLLIAARHGQAEIAATLLVNKAEVNLANDAGWTPLMVASRFGHREVAEVLLNDQAEMNLTNQAGKTALQLAADNQHADVVELLKLSGAK